ERFSGHRGPKATPRAAVDVHPTKPRRGPARASPLGCRPRGHYKYYISVLSGLQSLLYWSRTSPHASHVVEWLLKNSSVPSLGPKHPNGCRLRRRRTSRDEQQIEFWDEKRRPRSRSRAYMAHAAVCILPRIENVQIAIPTADVRTFAFLIHER